MSGGWSRAAWLDTVSSRCWWYTPLDEAAASDAAWQEFVAGDEELQRIVEDERALGHVPDWARQVVEGPINYLPGCGHYLFPRAYVEAVDAIGAQAPPGFIHGCYTADGGRKRRMAQYLLALDAWLTGAGPEDAGRELARLDESGTDWGAACADLWSVLGEHTEMKLLLVERTLHRQRWWLKSLVWDDDARDRFCQDRYLGDTGGSGPTYGNPDFTDPWFLEHRAGRVAEVEARLAAICEHWPWFRTAIYHSWLCAPKAFRFLEVLLWSIGRGRPAKSLPSAHADQPEPVPGFLRCEDTVLDPASAGAWWHDFTVALDDWWRHRAAAGAVGEDVRRRLDARTDVKRWLVRLLARKLAVHARYAEVGKLVSIPPEPNGR